MSRKKSIHTYIYCNVYRRGISVFIGSCNDLVKWAKIAYDDPTELDMIQAIENSCSEEEYREKNISARCYNSDCGSIIVHLPKFSFNYNPNEIASLDHELLHATFLLSDFLGVEYRYYGSNEPYTYLHEYLLREALDKDNYEEVLL